MINCFVMQSQKKRTSCYPHVPTIIFSKDWLEKGQGHVVQASPADLWNWKHWKLCFDCFGGIWLVLPNSVIPRNRFVYRDFKHDYFGIFGHLRGSGFSTKKPWSGLLRPGFFWTSGSHRLCCCKACSSRILRLLAGRSGRSRLFI